MIGIIQNGLPECANTHQCMLLAQLHYILHHQTPQSIYYVEMYLKRMFETGLDYCNTCSSAHAATQSEVQFVCTGCRTVCYCSREHQRLTWTKDAVQGMRIGHKILCPFQHYHMKLSRTLYRNCNRYANVRDRS